MTHNKDVQSGREKLLGGNLFFLLSRKEDISHNRIISHSSRFMALKKLRRQGTCNKNQTLSVKGHMTSLPSS